MPDENAPACGVSTSVFGHRMALTPAKVARLAVTGIDYIEISALQDQHLNIWDEERIAQIAKALPAAGLKLWSFHAPFCAIAMDDEATRADGVRRIVRSAHLAERLGAPVVIVHPGRDVPSRDRERELAWTVEGFCRALEQTPPGVTLALETMSGRSLAAPPAEMKRVMDQLDPRRVGVCVDAGHVNMGCDVVEYIGAVTGRIASVHLQDNHGERDEHLLAGDGDVDFPGAIAALRAAGYEGVLMSEGASPGSSPEENAREFATRMRRFSK